MARLGELLVAARLLDQEQVDRALRAQVLWGGRLGTNLIELGLLDLDGISRSLGRQHRIPAALARHFDKADRGLQQRLDPGVALRLSVVPLLYVGPEHQIAVAVLDPLSVDELDELADAFSCRPDTILVSVAAEMRLRYHLERVYGITRPTRFLRAKGKTVTPFPQFDNVPVPVDSDAEVAVPITVDETEHPTGRASVIIDVELAPSPAAVPPPAAVDDDIDIPIDIDVEEHVPPPPPRVAEDFEGLAALIDAATEQAAEKSPPEPTGRDRRSYLRTLGDEISPPGPKTPAPASVVAVPQPIGTAKTAPASLGRIAIKRVVAGDVKQPVAAEPSPEPAAAPKSFIEATRAIRRGTNRDRIGDLVIDTLFRFVPACEAAVLLVIRGAAAISWKQFSRLSDEPVELAVPLDQPGLVPTVVERNAFARDNIANLGPIDAALMRSLGSQRGDLVVTPIAIADRVMCLIAAATEANARIEALDGVGLAAATAFSRLIRDAGR